MAVEGTEYLAVRGGFSTVIESAKNDTARDALLALDATAAACAIAAHVRLVCANVLLYTVLLYLAIHGRSAETPTDNELATALMVAATVMAGDAGDTNGRDPGAVLAACEKKLKGNELLHLIRSFSFLLRRLIPQTTQDLANADVEFRGGRTLTSLLLNQHIKSTFLVNWKNCVHANDHRVLSQFVLAVLLRIGHANSKELRTGAHRVGMGIMRRAHGFTDDPVPGGLGDDLEADARQFVIPLLDDDDLRALSGRQGLIAKSITLFQFERVTQRIFDAQWGDDPARPKLTVYGVLPAVRTSHVGHFHVSMSALSHFLEESKSTLCAKDVWDAFGAAANISQSAYTADGIRFSIHGYAFTFSRSFAEPQFATLTPRQAQQTLDGANFLELRRLLEGVGGDFADANSKSELKEGLVALYRQQRHAHSERRRATLFEGTPTPPISNTTLGKILSAPLADVCAPPFHFQLFSDPGEASLAGTRVCVDDLAVCLALIAAAISRPDSPVLTAELRDAMMLAGECELDMGVVVVDESIDALIQLSHAPLEEAAPDVIQRASALYAASAAAVLRLGEGHIAALTTASLELAHLHAKVFSFSCTPRQDEPAMWAGRRLRSRMASLRRHAKVAWRGDCVRLVPGQVVARAEAPAVTPTPAEADAATPHASLWSSPAIGRTLGDASRTERNVAHATPGDPYTVDGVCRERVSTLAQIAWGDTETFLREQHGEEAVAAMHAASARGSEMHRELESFIDALLRDCSRKMRGWGSNKAQETLSACDGFHRAMTHLQELLLCHDPETDWCAHAVGVLLEDGVIPVGVEITVFDDTLAGTVDILGVYWEDESESLQAAIAELKTVVAGGAEQPFPSLAQKTPLIGLPALEELQAARMRMDGSARSLAYAIQCGLYMRLLQRPENAFLAAFGLASLCAPRKLRVLQDGGNAVVCLGIEPLRVETTAIKVLLICVDRDTLEVTTRPLAPALAVVHDFLDLASADVRRVVEQRQEEEAGTWSVERLEAAAACSRPLTMTGALARVHNVACTLPGLLEAYYPRLNLTDVVDDPSIVPLTEAVVTTTDAHDIQPELIARLSVVPGTYEPGECNCLRRSDDLPHRTKCASHKHPYRLHRPVSISRQVDVFGAVHPSVDALELDTLQEDGGHRSWVPPRVIRVPNPEARGDNLCTLWSGRGAHDLRTLGSRKQLASAMARSFIAKGLRNPRCVGTRSGTRKRHADRYGGRRTMSAPEEPPDPGGAVPGAGAGGEEAGPDPTPHRARLRLFSRSGWNQSGRKKFHSYVDGAGMVAKFKRNILGVLSDVKLEFFFTEYSAAGARGHVALPQKEIRRYQREYLAERATTHLLREDFSTAINFLNIAAGSEKDKGPPGQGEGCTEKAVRSARRARATDTVSQRRGRDGNTHLQLTRPEKELHGVRVRHAVTAHQGMHYRRRATDRTQDWRQAASYAEVTPPGRNDAEYCHRDWGSTNSMCIDWVDRAPSRRYPATGWQRKWAKRKSNRVHLYM